MAEHKTWWRNFEGAHPIRLQLAGATHDTIAHTVRDGNQVSVIAELRPEGLSAAPATPSPDCVPQQARVELCWLPLGAGDSTGCVRRNGRLFEALAARRAHRPPCVLYHSALQVQLDGDRFAIEMTPAWGNGAGDRGVMSTGPVGLRLLGRSRFFRYEVRRWRAGTIPDLAEAVGGPVCVTDDPALTQRLLELVPDVPMATWGRDELGNR